MRPIDLDRPLTYQPALDGIRAVAIAGVMAVHTRPSLLGGGGIGVYLFFALSGYLITTLLLAEARSSGGVDRTRFYARRALRLLPALVVLVIGVSVFTLLAPGWDARQVWIATPGVLFYFANWLKAFGVPTVFYGHAWSLSIEEQFYLLWPLLLVPLSRIRQGQLLVPALIGGMALAMTARFLLYQQPTDAQRIQAGTDTIADQILGGCLLAAVLWRWRGAAARRRVQRWLRLALPPAAALLVVTALYLPTTANGPGVTAFYRWGLTVIAVASSVVVGHVVTHPESLFARSLALPPLRWVGRVSYSLYLWHYPVFLVVSRDLNDSRWAIPLEVGISVALAACSHHLVERPILRLRGRIVPSRPAGPLLPAPSGAV